MILIILRILADPIFILTAQLILALKYLKRKETQLNLFVAGAVIDSVRRKTACCPIAFHLVVQSC